MCEILVLKLNWMNIMCWNNEILSEAGRNFTSPGSFPFKMTYQATINTVTINTVILYVAILHFLKYS